MTTKPTETAGRRKLRERVAELIRAAMVAKHVRPSELARRLGTSRPYVSNLLTGSENLTVEQFAHVLFVVGYRADVKLVRLARPRRPRAWCSCSKCGPCPNVGQESCWHGPGNSIRFHAKKCRDAYEHRPRRPRTGESR